MGRTRNCENASATLLISQECLITRYAPAKRFHFAYKPREYDSVTNRCMQLNTVRNTRQWQMIGYCPSKWQTRMRNSQATSLFASWWYILYNTFLSRRVWLLWADSLCICRKFKTRKYIEYVVICRGYEIFKV